MLKITIIESYSRIKVNLKVQSFYAGSWENHGPFTFCKISHKCAFCLAAVFQFHKCQVLVFIFLSNMCYEQHGRGKFRWDESLL